jgi:hypothetical protein
MQQIIIMIVIKYLLIIRILSIIIKYLLPLLHITITIRDYADSTNEANNLNIIQADTHVSIDPTR